MKEATFQTISPFVRRISLLETNHLFGTWTDPDHCFTIIAEGEADFYIHGTKYHLGKGNLILIPPLCKHMIISSGNLKQMIFHFDFYEHPHSMQQSFFQNVEDRKNASENPVPDCEQLLENQVITSSFSPEQFLKLQSLYFKLYQEEQRKEPFYRLIQKSLCIQILAFSFQHSNKTQETSNGKNRLKVQRTVDYIQQHYSNPDLNNDIIAEKVGVSSKYLSDIFRQEMGIQIHRYLNFVRIETAQNLALSGDLNITEIAHAVGYKSIHSFTKIFKKITGLTPTEFLNANVPDIESIYLKKP